MFSRSLLCALAATVFYAPQVRADVLRNLANTNYKGWYLDINATNGAVILSRQWFNGCNWAISAHEGRGTTLQNLGNSKYKGWYLDIDGRNGRVILSDRLYEGCFWDLSTDNNGRTRLSNRGRSPYRGWFLDINRDNGAVVLSNREFPGIWWTRGPNGGNPTANNSGNNPPQNQPPFAGIDVNGKRWSFPVVVSGANAPQRAKQIASELGGRLPTPDELKAASPELVRHGAFNKPLHVFFTSTEGTEWSVSSNTGHKDGGVYNGFDLVTVVSP